MTKTTIVSKTQPKLLAAIDASIAKLVSSERITKVELTFLSRSTLEYLVQNGSTDIGVANRILMACTPMNQATMRLFFNHFLPWTLDEETGTFGVMVKGDKKLQAYHEKVDAFLAIETNDVWTWAEANVDIDKKAFNMGAMITKAVELAMSGKKEGKTTLEAEAIPASEILQAVIAGGVSALDLMFMADELADTPTSPEAAAQEAVH